MGAGLQRVLDASSGCVGRPLPAAPQNPGGTRYSASSQWNARSLEADSGRASGVGVAFDHLPLAICGVCSPIFAE
jgi:hypothetical protein